MFRIGVGQDRHRLAEGRRFLLGGVAIPFERGEDGHSDGDVLIHAIIDALLGAASLGDIGELFPPRDPRYKDADSTLLLRRTAALIRESGWNIVNIDCIVICEKPLLLPYREAICTTIASLLNTPRNTVSVKGKTNEGCDSLGAGEAVEALAVCLMTTGTDISE
ncbi:MAG: 2-C-methyl-D-erythritol 2,4-cyclodiphosphate synthase [Treponema sp.]|jgi:2-C-methyl-D-erythritol 2,4-cyclodiphosphate synthase|nr:2-C-methyl-D-erythritol 2,4-cyclodiphosphate synthase [Treponema sp.]